LGPPLADAFRFGSVRVGRLLLAGLFIGSAAGAQTDSFFSLVPYLFQEGIAQGSLLLRAKPVANVLAIKSLDPKTERFLRLSSEILKFAKEQLGMKVGRSYQTYFDTGKPWVTQVVSAAHKDRLEGFNFQYPIIGAAPYRGFFSEDDAVAFELKLRAQGFDTYRRPVEAFSSLGWLPDPLTSCMFSTESRFIEVLFHELTHLNFFFRDEADFNEAFASWMGYRAALEFVRARKDLFPNAAALETELEGMHARQLASSGKIGNILATGRTIYGKAGATMDAKRSEFFGSITKLLGPGEWNNARVLAWSTYYDLVPEIDAFASQQGLTPAAYLKRVVETGPKIIPQIRASRVAQSK